MTDNTNRDQLGWQSLISADVMSLFCCNFEIVHLGIQNDDCKDGPTGVVWVCLYVALTRIDVARGPCISLWKNSGGKDR